MSEAGEIVQDINDGSIQASDIQGELRDLVTKNASGRTSNESITLFKSVGTAVEDLAAAELVLKNHQQDD
jgi:ornithine cyclodeaminase/alanine dehydrogenase-like protein (mu-crystallin family)